MEGSNLAFPESGYGLRYNDGRVCAGVPGTFLIKFVCGPILIPPTTPHMSVIENGQCQYEVTFPTSLVCGSPNVDPCGVADYDFSAISLMGEDHYYGSDTNGFDYQFNLCAGVASVCGPASRLVTAYQYDDEFVPETCQALGAINERQPPYWRVHTDGSPRVTYYGGSECDGGYTNVTYIFRCAPSLYPSGSHVFREVSPCAYEVDVHTSLAC